MDRTASTWERLVNGIYYTSNTPEELWKNAIAYFKWCDENSIIMGKSVGSGTQAGVTVTDTMPRPYTVKGLCLHCGVTEEWLASVKATPRSTNDFHMVVNKIMYIIDTQITEYALTGVFNPVFSYKILGMDKVESAQQPITIEIVEGKTAPQLANSEGQVNGLRLSAELEKRDLE